LLQEVKNALQELPESEREILVLKYLEKLTAEEIAEILGTTERTVWRRHGRAIERVGLILNEGTE
ncbi:MAG: sigma-70 family RNA polymerase sigma factor, partial [Planctomycetales bacterium]|nr:sigma-70 family RNA polymerase sigma factor [Planctomycetales bacterium]